MKSSTIIAIAIGAVGLVTLGYFLFGRANPPLQELKKEETSIMLYKESGFVTWRSANEAEYKRVEQDELALPNDVYIKTVEGRGYVVLPDNSNISLDQNTEIHVNFTPQHISIEQFLGSTYHRVASLLQGETYEVRTPGTLAAVRGTKFSVTYDKSKKITRIATTEHVVAVSPIDDITGVATGTPKSIEEGNVGVVADKKEVASSSTQGGKPQERSIAVLALTSVPEEKKWISQNKEVDRVLDSHKEVKEKREIIKDLMKELKQEDENSQSTSTPAVSSTSTPSSPKKQSKDRVEVVKKAVQKVEIRQKEKKNATPENKDIQLPAKTATTTASKEIVKPTVPAVSGVSSPATEQVTQTPTLKSFSMVGETLNPEDQAFIDGFYTLYEKYFFVDGTGAVCTMDANQTGASMVANLEKIANAAGYVLPRKTELLALADSIVAACKDGTISSKVPTLQTNFDVVYPFSQ